MNPLIKNFHWATALGAVAICLSLSPAQAQQVYKWKDDKGAIHYTQSPPSTKNAIRLDIKTRNVGNPVMAAENKATATTEDKTVANTSAKATPPKLKAEDCAILKSSLENLQSGRRLYEADDKGDRAYLTEEQKAQRIQTYSKSLNEGCS